MGRIAGIVSRSDGVSGVLDAMLSRFDVPGGVSHRWVDGAGALGAVAPATTGVLLASRGPLTIVFDGFIFTPSDGGASGRSAAEVFLDLMERLGFTEALGRLSGDFALAAYDASASKVWMARDRLGVKPLYYAQGTLGVSFASQPRALIGVGGVSARPNRTYVGLFAGSHYRTFDNDPTASPFADIAQLPAGHYLETGLGRAVRVKKYWSLADRPDFDAPVESLAEEYRGLLVDAVRVRLDAARSPAFTLSGGMDSSSVLGCAVHASGKKQHAFSSVYEDPTYDESHEIRTMLESAVAEWHPIRIGNPDVIKTVDRMVRAHDEPVATATWLSHFVLCEQMAALGFGGIFGGLGGDELNAGEYEYFLFNFADLRLTGDEALLASEIARWAEHHDHPIYRKDAGVASAGLERLVDLGTPGRCIVDRGRIGRYRSAVSREFFDIDEFEPVLDHPFRSFLKNRTYQDLFRETAPCCLRAEDRHGSAFGLDHFDPFFDHRLVEFMFRVPGRYKIRDGVTKILLREAMRGILPDETRTRIKKTGWNAPAHIWFSGAGLDVVRDLVASRAFRERGIYHLPEVERLIDEHERIVRGNDARENHMMFLWQLVNLELWLRQLSATELASGRLHSLQYGGSVRL